MSFQAYLDNVEQKTGVTPQGFIDLAKAKGFDRSTKAGEILKWLADEYDLGRGHGMAIVHVVKNGAAISDKHVNSGSAHSDPDSTLKLDGKDALPWIGAPAMAALAGIGITKRDQLQHVTEKELLATHGVGQKAIELLKKAGITLKKDV